LRMSLLYLFGGCFFLTTPNGTLSSLLSNAMRAQHSSISHHAAAAAAIITDEKQ